MSVGGGGGATNEGLASLIERVGFDNLAALALVALLLMCLVVLSVMDTHRFWRTWERIVSGDNRHVAPVVKRSREERVRAKKLTKKREKERRKLHQ